jgi:electron-transferring-flavoprotein dehydrogenase
VLYHEDGTVKGIQTGDMGIGKNGEPTHNFTPGYELHAKYTLFAEGCRGHLGKRLIAKYNLDKDADPQHYGIGIKELWEIDPAKHKPGLVMHGAGWPLSETGSAGGWWLYHAENNQVTLGMIVDLSYENPTCIHLWKCNVGKHTQRLSNSLKVVSVFLTAHVQL